MGATFTLHGRRLEFVSPFDLPMSSRRYVGRCGCGAGASVLAQRYRGVDGMVAVVRHEGTTHVQPWRQTVDCHACGAIVTVRPVDGTTNHAVACDVRCTSATGRRCECSCGGANHGKDHEH